MKNILGIVGSPRKNGNTHTLVSKILEGAKDWGANVQIILLDELTIKECNGCHACWVSKKCVKNDDMCDIYPKIIESDVIVFGTPVYWYAPTALMKCFIDRFVYFNCPTNNTKIQGKLAVIAIPFEEEDPETVAPMITFFEKCFQYLHMNLVGKIIVPGVSKKAEVLEKQDYIKEAYELGKKLALNIDGV